jgi:hypothetical protein
MHNKALAYVLKITYLVMFSRSSQNPNYLSMHTYTREKEFSRMQSKKERRNS